MVKRRRLKRYEYGDYFTNAEAASRGASPYYTENNLNTLSLPEEKKPGFFQNNQGMLAAAGTAVGEGIGAMADPTVDTQYNRSRSQAAKETKTIGAAASAINPLIGAGVAIGSGIGAQTVDEFGQYKSRAGNALDEMVNPVTGIQGVKRAFKGDQTASGVLNKLTVGLFGKSDNQKEAEAGKAKFERDRLNAIRKRSEQTLANYPVYGIGKYGMKFPNGGRLPYPTDDSEVNQLASNIAQYEGDTHAEGGIPLDINNDNAPEIEIEDKEVVKDDMVLSNRLKPSKEVRQVAKRLGLSIKKRETYATLAARLGKKKGEFEEKLQSTRPGEKNTAEIMTTRLDETIDMLFMDQQVRKFGRQGPKYPDGGLLPVNKIPVKSSVGVYGPEYAPQDPRTTPEQNQYRATHNLNQALRFKGLLTGANSNLVPASDYTEMVKNGIGGTPQQQVGGSRRNYIPVDPRAIQRADSVINVSRPMFANPNMVASRKFGGYLPDGGYLSGKQYKERKTPNLGGAYVTDPFTKESSRTMYRPEIGELPLGEYQEPAYVPTPRSFDIGDYKGDIAAGLGTIANQIQINKLETNFDPELIDTPKSNYTDRTGAITSMANQQFTAASRGINNSSSQDNLALKSNLYAKSLAGINQALDNETQRKDQIMGRHSELVNRTNIYNSQIKNQGKIISMENRNKKRALTQANLDNLVRSYIGNEAGRDFKSSEYSRNYLTAMRSGDRGVDARLIQKLPKATRRQLGYQ